LAWKLERSKRSRNYYLTFLVGVCACNAVKAGYAGEHWYLLLQAVLPKNSTNFFLLFLKEQIHISARDNPPPHRKAVSKSSHLLRASVLLSTAEACLFYSGSCQIGEKGFY